MLAQKLKEIVVSKIDSDRLELPAMPTVALRCIELLQDPNVALPEVAREVERDPMAAAQVLKLANSVAFGGASATTTIAQACTRLGIGKLKALFLHMSAKQVFQSHDVRIADAFKGIWHHSLAVAVLARDIAALMGTVHPELAYQSGLLHDIGKPVVAVILLEMEKSLGSAKAPRKWMPAATWMETVQAIHRPVAVKLTQKWNLSLDIQQAVANCSEYDVASRQSASNVVRFANAVTKKLGLYNGTPVDQSEIDTLIMVGRSLVGVDDKVLDRISDELGKRIDELLV